MVMVRILLVVTMITMREIGTVEINTAEVHHLFIAVGVNVITITENTLVKESGIIMIMKKIEVVREVAAGVERRLEIVDVIERTDLVEIDLEKGMEKVVIGIKIDLDREIGLVKDPGILTVLDHVIDLAIEKDLVIEEIGTAKTIDLVEVVV